VAWARQAGSPVDHRRLRVFRGVVSEAALVRQALGARRRVYRVAFPAHPGPASGVVDRERGAGSVRRVAPGRVGPAGE